MLWREHDASDAAEELFKHSAPPLRPAQLLVRVHDVSDVVEEPERYIAPPVYSNTDPWQLAKAFEKCTKHTSFKAQFLKKKQNEISAAPDTTSRIRAIAPP